MPERLETFITQTKLQELRLQREALLRNYDSLLEISAQTTDRRERLQKLYNGLRKTRFAGRPLHPDVASVRLLLNEISAAPASAGLVDFWLKRLEQEVRYGRSRAEAVYVFGALLEEWNRQSGARSGDRPDEIRATLIEQVTTPGTTGDYETILAPLIAPYADGYDEARKRLKKNEGFNGIRGRVTPAEVEAHLKRIRGDIYRPPWLRTQAGEFLSNEAWRKEFADTLTIMMDHLDSHAWDAEGVPVEAVWTRTKWRLLLNEDLPTACLLEILGERWSRVVKLLFQKRKPELNIPDIHADREPPPPGKDVSADSMDYICIAKLRKQTQNTLRDDSLTDVYGGIYSVGTLDKALLAINAELQTAQAAYPGQPLYITKIDLKDYYPTIPHAVLLYALKQFGVPDTDIDFFRHYMELALRHNNQSVTMRRGVLSHRILSDVLGEILMRLLDDYVHTSAGVYMVRVVDDICLITSSPEQAVKGWQAVRDFCAACGLTMNLDKCGSVAVHGTRPAELPEALPRWQLVVLQSDGTWHILNDKLDEFISQTRERIRKVPAVISQVEVYNASVKYLMRAISTSIWLGDAHREEISKALAKFHHGLFDENNGIVEGLQSVMKERFLDAAGSGTIPDALLYWPITAGGLGLTHPMVTEASFAERARKTEFPSIPEKHTWDWQRRNNAWYNFYLAYRQAEIKPVNPDKTPILESLTADFIARGAGLTSGRQKDLSFYWRWILYLYGPQILEEFGTFRFLIEELVPLQLISQQRMGESSLFDEG